MATVVQTPDVATEAGVVPTALTGLSTANTYKFRNNGRTSLRVTNAGASPCTVTIIAAKSVGSHAVANQTVVVAAGTTQVIGALQRDIYNDVNGDASYTLSYITSVTVEVVQN
jgi:hypothetical protein